MPVAGTPKIWPLSSNDTSAVGGSTESTRLTSLLPLVSLIKSPSIVTPLLSVSFELLSRGVRNCTPEELQIVQICRGRNYAPICRFATLRPPERPAETCMLPLTPKAQKTSNPHCKSLHRN